MQFNKENGAYIQNTIVPNEKLSIFGQKSLATPAIKNNQVVISIVTDLPNKQFGLVRWNTNGQFIDLTYAMSYPNQMLGTGPTVLNDYGNVLVVPQVKGSFSLNEQVHVICSAVNSNAVFALYHNPEFTQPFVPDDSVGISDYLDKRESDIYIYPNPTSGRVTVVMNGRPLRELYVAGMDGIAEPLPFSALGDGRYAADLTGRPDGVYVLVMVSDDEHAYRSTVILQR